MSNESNNLPVGSLIDEDQLPTLDSERNVSYFNVFFLFASIAVNIGAFTMALSLYPQMAPLQILGVMWLAFSFVCF